LDKAAQAAIATYSTRLFHRIECRDYARFDWRLDGAGHPRLLEANPNCGWCWDGHLPKTAGLCGVNYARFFEMVMESAFERAEAVQKRKGEAGFQFVTVGKTLALSEHPTASTGQANRAGAVQGTPPSPAASEDSNAMCIESL
jgi:hypothetical protein